MAHQNDISKLLMSIRKEIQNTEVRIAPDVWISEGSEELKYDSEVVSVDCRPTYFLVKGLVRIDVKINIFKGQFSTDYFVKVSVGYDYITQSSVNFTTKVFVGNMFYYHNIFRSNLAVLFKLLQTFAIASA